MSQTIRAVTDADLERVRAFLEAHLDTSLFLLGNLTALGHRLGEDPRSGNYKLLEESGRIDAVFCLTRRGNLLVQAAGRADLAAAILHACREEPMPVCGTAGEWLTAEAIWELLQADPEFVPRHGEKEVLYALAPLRADAIAAAPGASREISVQSLEPEDFGPWARLNTAYCDELNLPHELSEEQRRARFVASARARLWWGAFHRDTLVAIAGLNASYGSVGQVGGVYTEPGYRQQGLSRATMEALISDCAKVHRFARLILFTGEGNAGARRLYESLGFKEQGAFGLLLGERRSQDSSRQARP
jgi:predicted GNAT family acetyltransferase